jgi:23S rRNA (pseudouridine1915-N3)-methyltransferase
MRVSIAAVGRLKDGPERELFARYWERLEGLGRKHALGPLSLTEIAESRASSATARCNEEATKLVGGLGSGALVRLDAGGRQFSSEAFAADLRRMRDGGVPGVTFLLGGPDGHGDAVSTRPSSVLSLGLMTLPHGLARVVLVEQLYRAATLLAGHPYHRA